MKDVPLEASVLPAANPLCPQPVSYRRKKEVGYQQRTDRVSNECNERRAECDQESVVEDLVEVPVQHVCIKSKDMKVALIVGGAEAVQRRRHCRKDDGAVEQRVRTVVHGNLTFDMRAAASRRSLILDVPSMEWLGLTGTDAALCPESHVKGG